MDNTQQETNSKTKLWKETVENILMSSKVCAICLSENKELDHWEDVFYIEVEKKEKRLKEIITATYGIYVNSLLPSKYFCNDCVTVILRSYNLTKKIKLNYCAIQKFIKSISKQINIWEDEKSKQNEVEKEMKKELFLTINNTDSLKVPTTLLQSLTTNTHSAKIFVCDIDEDNTEPELFCNDSEVKYECPYCGKRSYNYEQFSDHHKKHQEKFFRCVKCLKRFKLFEDLIYHRTNNHSDILSICKVCKIILHGSESTEHTKDHDILFFDCSLCDMSFQTKLELKNHNLEYPFVECKTCLKSFANVKEIDKHECSYCSECKRDDCIHYVYLNSYMKQKIAGLTKLKCPYENCDYEYMKKCEIIDHANVKHLLTEPHSCTLCSENFSSLINLENHKKEIELVSKQQTNINIEVSVETQTSCLRTEPSELINITYECQNCKILFNTNEAYENHKINIKNVCSVCKKSYCNISQLIIHIQKKHIPDNNDSYECIFCNVDFETKSLFVEHLGTHSLLPDYYSCKECNLSFDSIETYYVHACKSKPYSKKCPICLKNYTKYTISRHMKLHFNGRVSDIACELCEVKLPSIKALINHAEKHSLQRQCSLCKKNVKSALYMRHCDTHNKSKNWKDWKSCGECDYKTRFQWCLDAHINRHHKKVRPFKCHICERSFYALYTLKNHSVIHEAQRLQLCCHICGHSFKSKKAVMLHLRLHTGEAPYPCEHCELRFISASRRQQHVIRKHFEPSVECGICKKMLYTQTTLRRHMKKVHGLNKGSDDKQLTELVEEEVLDDDCEMLVLND